MLTFFLLVHTGEVDADSCLLTLPTKYKRKIGMLVGKGTTNRERNSICNLIGGHF